MIHLRARIISFLLHSPSRHPASRFSPIFALHRNLSAATTSTAATPFAAEDYLVATCGVTRAQALKASKKISHLKSSSKPDAVLAFLSDLGVPRSDITTLVAVDPRFLCASVERTLAPRVTELSELGLSRSQIARLVPLALCSFRSSSLSRNLDFWLSVFGSYDKLLKALRMNSGLLAADLDKVAKPNLALLQQCGLNPSLFSEPFISRVLVRTPQQVQDALAHIDKFGVSQNSRMFLYALVAFTVQSPEKLTDKIQVLETLGWSHDDVLLAVKKMPGILTVSEERLQRNMHFLTKVAGLEISYIAQRPVLLKYSLERRLFPRYRLLKLLNEKGLLDLRKYPWNCYQRRRTRQCAMAVMGVLLCWAGEFKVCHLPLIHCSKFWSTIFL
ncbi:transcription termination factor MTEF1, chloroplastic-like isoform X2 [Lolium rigidum]|uniref:transcription termination factor MTEF1, chloroplastic-like isoform X2 n=1 Tax=Lolium rigidum TaxID=89674 RepID=UPI001F5D52B1|nr:transcription termination factor MTEF1, chloroplastic-like isoform X2 [Lolium rigidum]